MKLMRLFAAMVVLVPSAYAPAAAPSPGPWDQPAAALAGQIADILGPGQARLTIRNLSTIPDNAIPAISRLLEQDLKDHGVTASGSESANSIRITLSESAENRIWVAEVAEGDETQVAIVNLKPERLQQAPATGGLLLRSELVITGGAPVLAALEVTDSLVVLEPEALVIYARAADGWQEQKRVNLGEKAPLARDPRGALMPNADGGGFEAWLPGTRCAGMSSTVGASVSWSISCAVSDDPWTLFPAANSQPSAQAGTANPAASEPLAFKAFYNAARNYFTGVVSPGLEIDLPAFYSAVVIPRAAGNAALLLDGIDGKVQLAENGALEAVAGTRDWGSDLGVLRSGCGTGAQIVASGSGEAASDSLRAYEMPALEAVPASAPLAMNGTVTAVWPAPDAKSLYAAVHTPANQYEVERVSALCN
jgi:hypothetical protein